MVDNAIDRGGSVGPDIVVAEAPGTVVARSGGWGNIALIGAGIGLIGAMGGIAIGYSAFHRPAAATSAAQPARASDRAVDDAMQNPNAQRAALASQLGQPGAPATDIFGRPIIPTGPTVDASGNPVPATGGATPAMPANGQQTPDQRRAEQARLMADAARRSPIMAFGATGSGSAAPALGYGDATGVGSAQEQDPGQGAGAARPGGQSMVAGRNFGASGFGAAGDDSAAPARGSTDFSDQLGHSAIQTVV